VVSALMARNGYWHQSLSAFDISDWFEPAGAYRELRCAVKRNLEK